MFFVLFLSAALCIGLGYFVIAPLLSAEHTQQNAVIASKGFSDENELRQTLLLRDHLFAKLIAGQSQTDTVDRLNTKETMEALVSVCERLKRFGFPIFPSGAAKILAWLIMLPLVGAVLLNPLDGIAQALPDPSSAAAPSDGGNHGRPNIPPLHTDPATGFSFATLHQFVLSPRMGSVQVFYLGVFNNIEDKSSASIAMPLPEGFEELKLANQAATLEGKGTQFPVITFPLKPGVNELRAEFSLPASTGTLEWGNATLPPIPGTMLLLMPEHQSALRNMLEGVFPSFNLWPARIVNAPMDFKSEKTLEEHNPSDPNYAMLRKMPPEYTRNLVRSVATPTVYPKFKIVGVVPSRIPLYSLGGLFAAFLFGTAGFTIANAGKKQKGA